MTIAEAERLLAQIRREPQIAATCIDTYYRGVRQCRIRVVHERRQRVLTLTSADEWEGVREAWRELTRKEEHYER